MCWEIRKRGKVICLREKWKLIEASGWVGVRGLVVMAVMESQHPLHFQVPMSRERAVKSSKWL